MVDDKKKLLTIKDVKRKYSKELRFKQQKSISVSESLIYIRFIDRLSRRLDTQNERVSETEESLDQKRKELLEALKKKKILERLNEKGIENYKRNALKRESNFLNEMASVRFNRNF